MKLEVLYEEGRLPEYKNYSDSQMLGFFTRLSVRTLKRCGAMSRCDYGKGMLQGGRIDA